MSALEARALAARALEDAGGNGRELAAEPVLGLIEFARTLVGVDGRERDLAVMLDTIERLVDREIARHPRELPLGLRT